MLDSFRGSKLQRLDVNDFLDPFLFLGAFYLQTLQALPTTEPRLDSCLGFVI